MSYARDMQRMVSAERQRIGQFLPTSSTGFRLVARWWYWDAKEYKSGQSLQYAKNQYALARDMEAHQDYYTRKPNNRTHWQWFKERTSTGASES